METQTSLRWRNAALLFFQSASFLQSEDAPFTWCINAALSITNTNLQLSLGIEWQLSCFAKTRAREYWRDAVFEVETKLSLCWSDADFKVDTWTSLYWRDVAMLSARVAFWVCCHVFGGAEETLFFLNASFAFWARCHAYSDDQSWDTGSVSRLITASMKR